MIYLIPALFFILIAIVGLIVYLSSQKKELGILNNKWIYADTDLKPGRILYADSIPLSGKPDYLIEKNQMIIPVEVKTGRTPSTPYLNHTSQLMAYCYLVEENFGIRPIGGYLKYPEKEFKILFTDEARQSVIDLTEEILQHKLAHDELTCRHPEHN